MLGVYALDEIENSMEPRWAQNTPSPAYPRGGLRREKHLGPSLYPIVKIAILKIETKRVALPFPCILKTSLHMHKCIYVDKTPVMKHLGLSSEVLLVGLDLGLLLDLVEVELRDCGVVAVDDLGELLEGGALGLDVHDVDEDELEGDPAL